LNPQIIYTNPAAKPTRPTAAPTPEAPAQAPAPLVKRIRLGWGEEGCKGVAARSEAIATEDGQQPRRGTGELPSSRLVRARRSESRSFSEAPSKIEMGRVERSSKLERIRGNRLLSEKLDQGLDKRPGLEYLTILHSQSAQQYWIADMETGKVFLPHVFITLKHSHEAAAELERTFDMSEVLKLRPSETLERMGELAREHWLRERVAVVLG
jgi:hypothetical protein